MYRYGDPWILANFMIRTQRLQLAYHEETEAKLGDPVAFLTCQNVKVAYNPNIGPKIRLEIHGR